MSVAEMLGPAPVSVGDQPSPLSVEGLPPHWARLSRVAAGIARHTRGLGSRAEAESARLVATLLDRGALPDLLLREAVGLDEVTGIMLFNRLYRARGLDGCRPPSPVASEPDPTWMSRVGYCFVNVRATARLESQTGSFLSASRLLPCLRARAIHLAPFFESVFGVIYAQDSFTCISRDVVHQGYEALGVSRADQLQYFIDCCHLLGKAVGFDLTAHTCGFSRPSLDRPEVFRWLRFAEDCSGLVDGMTIDEQYSEAIQARFADHIRSLTAEICAAYNLPCLECEGHDPARVAAVHEIVKTAVRSFGYYPVVPHTWNGIGLPGLKGYDQRGDYPIWDYRDAEGVDQSAHGIGMHAALRLHTNLRANASPHLDPIERETWRSEPVPETLDFMEQLFARMHCQHGFDFLRIDYVDHIFESAIEVDGREVVLCEQPSPRQLAELAARARRIFPAAGMLADHVGTDIDRYRCAGFAAILGMEVQWPVDKQQMLGIFHRGHELAAHQEHDPGFGTVCLPIDTHDMGHPALLGRDLAEREDRAGVLLRHLLARFVTAGVGLRPKYETMGCQDGSTGIFTANNEPRSLAWGEDRLALAAYHLIEDCFEQVRDRWLDGRVVASFVHEDHCWWRVDSPEHGVSWVVLTWFGPSYRWDQAPGHRIRTEVPCAEALAARSISPLLGLRPGSGDAVPAGADGGDQVRLEPSWLEVECGDGRLVFTWPCLSSWIVEIAH